MNYAPSSTPKHWFRWKQNQLKNFMKGSPEAKELFERYIPGICFDRGIQAPRNQSETDALWDSLAWIMRFGNHSLHGQFCKLGSLRAVWGPSGLSWSARACPRASGAQISKNDPGWPRTAHDGDTCPSSWWLLDHARGACRSKSKVRKSSS